MRILFIVLRLAALVTTVSALISRADCVFTTGSCRASNLLSYFTVESNLAFVALLVYLLFHAITKRVEDERLTSVRALVTTYLIVSGITFVFLIVNAGLANYGFLIPTSEKMLHFVVPAYALVDFLLVPGRRRLHWGTALISLGFPLLYGIYTLVRGPAVGWYPYIFLDPQWAGSYSAVAVYAAILAGLIVAVSFALTATSRLPTPQLGRLRDR
ncbi:Pr6Pr family membrane protein [Subtercola sp. PAMC28395]|uniref:Pr6Pr family membrane protein n=1 Tax=Subtercola sp. PAMC28395 TaxID=2846775 RepID=UPI001C0B3E79|nr:Pr6Pr family membrane protein [Subtercola sp. PAMC28395]QWT23382.1 Pr6Pr family membrane protein [Subtercola sp. PAMC28395]